MIKKINIKLTKLLKYYSLINYNLIYDNKPINRFKNNNFSMTDKNNKDQLLKKLKVSISNIKNCELKKKGLPFVGRAGQLLDKMLLSINLNRKNVYITNVVNFRPPENRKPSEDEVARYLPYLIKHIEIISPKILQLLGSTALNALVGNQEVISKARGKWINKKIGKCSTFVIASFHPAFLMRQPEQKKMAWIDLKMIRKKIKELKKKIEK